MPTQPQILANRRNAQKSTGPQTPQGKAVVSQNALKHGLSARRDVITTESQADFDLHRDALLAELAPQGPMESILAADRIVGLSWRLKRADLIQNQTIDAMYEKITSDPLANLGKSFGLEGLGNPQPETSDPPPDLTLGRIAIKDFSNARVLDRLLMYERRIEHSLYKTTLELQRLRLLRNLEPSEPNLEPEDRRLSSGPVPGGSTEPNNTPEPGQNHPTSTIQACPPKAESSIIAQNKPNSRNDKTNATIVTAKNYERKPPQPHAKKQTQTNPIPLRRELPAKPNTNPACRGVAPSEATDVPRRAGSRGPALSRLRRYAISHNSPMDTLTKSSYNAP